MTGIVQMSKDEANFYPQTHAQAVLGLPAFSSFEKASDVQTAITNAIKGIKPTDLTNYPTSAQVQTAITNALGKVDVSQTMNASTRNKLQNMNKEMGS